MFNQYNPYIGNINDNNSDYFSKKIHSKSISMNYSNYLTKNNSPSKNYLDGRDTMINKNLSDLNQYSFAKTSKNSSRNTYSFENEMNNKNITSSHSNNNIVNNSPNQESFIKKLNFKTKNLNLNVKTLNMNLEIKKFNKEETGINNFSPIINNFKSTYSKNKLNNLRSQLTEIIATNNSKHDDSSIISLFDNTQGTSTETSIRNNNQNKKNNNKKFIDIKNLVRNNYNYNSVKKNNIKKEKNKDKNDLTTKLFNVLKNNFIGVNKTSNDNSTNIYNQNNNIKVDKPKSKSKSKSKSKLKHKNKTPSCANSNKNNKHLFKKEKYLRKNDDNYLDNKNNITTATFKDKKNSRQIKQNINENENFFSFSKISCLSNHQYTEANSVENISAISTKKNNVEDTNNFTNDENELKLKELKIKYENLLIKQNNLENENKNYLKEMEKLKEKQNDLQEENQFLNKIVISLKNMVNCIILTYQRKIVEFSKIFENSKNKYEIENKKLIDYIKKIKIQINIHSLYELEMNKKTKIITSEILQENKMLRLLNIESYKFLGKKLQNKNRFVKSEKDESKGKHSNKISRVNKFYDEVKHNRSDTAKQKKEGENFSSEKSSKNKKKINGNESNNCDEFIISANKDSKSISGFNPAKKSNYINKCLKKLRYKKMKDKK